ncbi:sialic acid-binding Ig-like lectin 5 isoform X1 [Poeciliopsis prolifica]|uniref:sialic acid-binding Ig-like lectin 5 isoform X1 n=1 Tax=Poeciliopsis prolifica TaxID=188132 RepID=UPI0024131323|nr:sialic acid-binding Ig-like lectin 5 isoform X1 [Poeciliopsis prolifica]
MFSVFWTTLLFFLWGSTTYRVESALGEPDCNNGYCISLNEGVITAEAGLCVVIPCSFTTVDGFTPKSIVWFKCESWKRRCGDSDIVFHINRDKVPSEFLGRILLLDPDVSQRNCSIMINDLTTSDSGSYQLRVNGLYHGSSDGVTFLSKTSLSVKDLSQRPSLKIPPLTEGQQATLTCTAPGLCSGSPPNITWMWRGKGEMEANVTGNMTASFKTENLTAVSHMHSSILTFNSSAKLHNTNVTCKVSFISGITTEETVTLKVNYKRQPQINGKTTVKEGDDLNLICNVESFPQSVVVWTRHSGSGIYSQNNTGSATLVISNVTTEDSGQYVCTANHLNETVSVYADVKVSWFSKILKSSGCVHQSALLTCVCISEGFPLPTITWPLLKVHKEYSVIKTVSNHRVNSTVTISLKNLHYVSFECDSSHENEDAKENLTIQEYFTEKEAIQSKTILEKVFSLQVIVAFLIGVLLSAIICYLAAKCNRKTLKKSENEDGTLKMISQDDPRIDDGQDVQSDITPAQEEAVNIPIAGEKSASETSEDSKDVQYASIDFSIMKRRSTKEAAKKQASTLTEYAEIKTRLKEQRKDDSKKECETLECEDEDLTTKHAEQMKHCVTEEQNEVEAVYSTVKDALVEI